MVKTRLTSSKMSSKPYSTALASLLLLALLGTGCNKSSTTPSANNSIITSATGAIDAPIDKFNLAVDGSNDTIYVFSNSKIEVRPSDATSWVQVIEQSYQPGSKSYRVIIRADTMKENFSQRIGELDFSNEDQYARKFLQLTQGYKKYLQEDFSWLHYGHGNPLNLNEGILIKDWTPAQIKYGWSADIQPGQSMAYAYGKDGYIQLGSENTGANIITPIVTGVQNDSLLLLTFNATAYIDQAGLEDHNKLTVQLEGGLFEDGHNAKVINLNYIDYSSALITTTMWNNSFYGFTLQKNAAMPFSTTLQVKFTTGANTPSANNRLFLDNVHLFSKMQYVPQENKATK